MQLRNDGTTDPWASRVGPQSAAALVQALRYKRIGGSFTIAFVVAEIVFQSVGSRLGMQLSVALIIAATYFFVKNFRVMSQARRQGAAYLGAPGSGPYIPLADTEVFDQWLSARDEARWPKKWRRRA